MIRSSEQSHGNLFLLVIGDAPGALELRAATSAEDIVESAPTDYDWGVGREGTGQNRLGKIIERIRAELRIANQ